MNDTESDYNILISILAPEWALYRIAKAVEQNLPNTPDGRNPAKVTWIPRIKFNTPQELMVAYPAPRPDIPALIRAWHAEPNRENMFALWKPLRDHAGKIGAVRDGAFLYRAAGDPEAPSIEIR